MPNFDKNYFQSIGDQFRINGEVVSFTQIGQDEFKVDYSTKKCFLFQRYCFPAGVSYKKVFENIRRVGEGLDQKNLATIHYHHTNQKDIFISKEDCAWSVQHFYKKLKKIHEIQPNAKESGTALARFQLALFDFDISKLENTYGNLNDSVKLYSLLKQDNNEEYAYFRSVKDEITKLFKLSQKQEIPLRVSLNVDKPQKVYFDRFDTPIALIELDYVQPGLSLTDFAIGALLICKKLDNVELDLTLFEEYLRGYLPIAKNYLNDLELASLYESLFSTSNTLALKHYIHYQNSQENNEKELTDSYIELAKWIQSNQKEIQLVIDKVLKLKAKKNALISSIDRENIKSISQEDYKPGQYMDIIMPHKINMKGDKGYAFFKRAFDIFASLLALIVLSPLMILTAILVKLTSKGPVLYVSKRVGRYGKIFRFYKFRSMYQDAEAHLDELLSQNEVKGGVTFKLHNDPRITPFGKFIRKTSIDELPQLWNILKGNMSIIGPRAGLPREVKLYPEEALDRLLVPQGLSGEWQANGRSNTTFENMVKMDLDYIQNKRGLRYDLHLIFKTILIVFTHEGAE